MSPQSPSVFTPRRRWLAGLSLAVLAVGVAAGAGATGMFGPEKHPDRGAAARPANSSAAGTAAPTSLPTSTSTPARTASSAGTGSLPAPTPRVLTPAQQLDPGTWSNRQLAAVLVMTGAKMTDAAAIQHAAASGVGGVVLFGPSSPSLAQTLRKARAVAPRGNPPLIASDEEGGAVQRLSPLIYRLPSAEVMGQWRPAKITATARSYALKMKALGVNVALSPSFQALTATATCRGSAEKLRWVVAM
jgi:hypothetical protein